MKKIPNRFVLWGIISGCLTLGDRVMARAHHDWTWEVGIVARVEADRHRLTLEEEGGKAVTYSWDGKTRAWTANAGKYRGGAAVDTRKLTPNTAVRILYEAGKKERRALRIIIDHPA